jgi:hypothetical protein
MHERALGLHRERDKEKKQDEQKGKTTHGYFGSEWRR